MKRMLITLALFSVCVLAQNITDYDLSTVGTGLTGVEPSIAINNNNEILLGYMQFQNSTPQIISKLIHSNLQITENIICSHGSDPDVEFDSYGNAYICYVDGTNNNAVVVKRSIDGGNYDSLNTNLYNNISYLLNTSGLNNRLVKLRLVVSSDSEIEFALKELYATDFILAKSNIKHKIIDIKNENITYNLAQNYPNPFNPSTKISYQIQERGNVTVKVFDILGNEIKTLVNEFKEKGEYNIIFDAKELSSGVYIYQIKSGDFIFSKKMTLLK